MMGLPARQIRFLPGQPTLSFLAGITSQTSSPWNMIPSEMLARDGVGPATLLQDCLIFVGTDRAFLRRKARVVACLQGAVDGAGADTVDFPAAGDEQERNGERKAIVHADECVALGDQSGIGVCPLHAPVR